MSYLAGGWRTHLMRPIPSLIPDLGPSLTIWTFLILKLGAPAFSLCTKHHKLCTWFWPKENRLRKKTKNLKLKLVFFFCLFADLDYPCCCSPSIKYVIEKSLYITAVSNLTRGRVIRRSSVEKPRGSLLLEALWGKQEYRQYWKRARVQEKTWLEYVLFYCYAIKFLMVKVTWPENKLSFTLSLNTLRSVFGHYQWNTVTTFRSLEASIHRGHTHE